MAIDPITTISNTLTHNFRKLQEANHLLESVGYWMNPENTPSKETMDHLLKRIKIHLEYSQPLHWIVNEQTISEIGK